MLILCCKNLHTYIISIQLTLGSNTAQILTSLYEADEQASLSQIQEPLQLLEEALQLFSKCLAKQEEQAQASQAQSAVPPEYDDEMDAMDNDDGGVSLSDTSSAPQEERWASIVEPVTNGTILDTLLIQLETLTTFVKALPQGQTDAIGFASKYASDIFDKRSVSFHVLCLPVYSLGITMLKIILGIGRILVITGQASCWH